MTAMGSMAVVALVLPLGAGCQTNEPVIWSNSHNKRHMMTFAGGFQKVHTDFDRIFLNMEENPAETFGDHVKPFLYGFHRLHMDIDRIIFDMEEFPLESDY